MAAPGYRYPYAFCPWCRKRGGEIVGEWSKVALLTVKCEECEKQYMGTHCALSAPPVIADGWSLDRERRGRYQM